MPLPGRHLFTHLTLHLGLQRQLGGDERSLSYLVLFCFPRLAATSGMSSAFNHSARICGSNLSARFTRNGPGIRRAASVLLLWFGGECKQIQYLLRSILHRGNSERPHRFAVRLRDVNTSQGLRLITPTL